MTAISPFASRLLDASRGVAALVVVIGHLTHLSVVAYGGDIGALPFFYVFVGLSHQAVVVFFALSGFLIGGEVVAASRSGRAFLSLYLVDRTVRIYTVLLPGLALTAICDAIGAAAPASRAFYAASPFVNSHSAVVLAANVANLQDSIAEAYGSNGPLWSLGCEYWYYVMAGLVGAALTRGARHRPARYGLVLVALAIFLVKSNIPGRFGFGFLIWCLGAAARVLPMRLPPRPRVALALLAASACFAIVCIGRAHIVDDTIYPLADAVVAMSFLLVVLCANSVQGQPSSAIFSPAFTFLSKISYSLYVAHMPLVVLVCATVGGFAPALILPLGLCVAIGGAALFHAAFESRTAALRRQARQLVQPVPPNVRETATA